MLGRIHQQNWKTIQSSLVTLHRQEIFALNIFVGMPYPGWVTLAKMYDNSGFHHVTKTESSKFLMIQYFWLMLIHPQRYFRHSWISDKVSYDLWVNIQTRLNHIKYKLEHIKMSSMNILSTTHFKINGYLVHSSYRNNFFPKLLLSVF